MTRPLSEQDINLGQRAYRAHSMIMWDDSPAFEDLSVREQTAWVLTAAVMRRSLQRPARTNPCQWCSGTGLGWDGKGVRPSL